jgi:transcriptional regulator with XRE-family HTH domain
MDSRPSPPPEAALIRLARKAAGLTVSEAARRAGASMARGISTSRWSQVENGYEVRAGGEARRVEAEAGMLAHMAHAVGLTPERLESEGLRPDAAGILREMLRGEAAGDSRPDAPRERTLPIIAALLAAPGIDGYLAEVRAERNGGGFAVRDDEELRIWADPLLREDEKRTLVAYGRLEQDKAVRSSREDAGLMRA